uniref:Carboxypeptidase N subunit 2-like n=1 Tax=Erpetoichthys calabaricus TaxID=27687 RepID=A0A8C4T0U9_ERPCA
MFGNFYTSLLLVSQLFPYSCSSGKGKCPKFCCCSHDGPYVFCDDLGLRSLPPAIPSNTTVLSLMKNNFCDLDRELFNFLGLQELNLSYNSLTHVPRGLPRNLEALYLRANRISYLTVNMLRQMRNITKLDLCGNLIKVIQSGAFSILMKLEDLNLQGNKLSSIPMSLPTSLVQLDVSNNQICDINPSSLQGLTNLQALNVSANCLKYITEPMFENLPRLAVIQLQNNLWFCDCGILYLYRWLTNTQLLATTDIACMFPYYFARRLLLTLSVAAICPNLAKRNHAVSNSTILNSGIEKAHNIQSIRKISVAPTKTACAAHYHASGYLIQPKKTSEQVKNQLKLLSEHQKYTLDRINLKACQATAGNKDMPDALSAISSGRIIPEDDPTCEDGQTSQFLLGSTTTVQQMINKTNYQAEAPQEANTRHKVSTTTAVLVVLSMMMFLVLITVLIVLKKILERNQRVAPANVE